MPEVSLKVKTWTEVMQEKTELVAAATAFLEAVINRKITANEL